MAAEPAGPWRIMFLGQGPLAEGAYFRLLEVAANGDLQVPVACSNPCGDDKWWGSARIRESAAEHSMVFVSNQQRNDSILLRNAAECSINCIISVGHPWILPDRVLVSRDRVAAFNLHNAPLPRFGGFNTGSHAILEGVTHFGATLHWMEPAPDAGPIAFAETFQIPEDATAKALHGLTMEAGRHLFEQLVDCLVHQRLPPRAPMTSPAFIYPRNALSVHREILNTASEVEVDRKSRAFWFPPFEPAFYRTLGKKYYVVPSQAFSDLLTPD
jgi:methionyl-tRNA formyltransferase